MENDSNSSIKLKDDIRAITYVCVCVCVCVCDRRTINEKECLNESATYDWPMITDRDLSLLVNIINIRRYVRVDYTRFTLTRSGRSARASKVGPK